jgi:three-Cys-motif partner protein
MTPSNKPHEHPDELRIVEDHQQTEHKLDVMRRYFGAYPTIIARARRLPNNREAWLIDTHAGAGQHGSRQDPDGYRFGSPLIACHEARMVQKHFARFRVHVRAIEKRPEWVFRLSPRIQVFTRGDEAWQVVDAKVLPGDFADYVEGLLIKAQKTRALSLWFVDPFGFVDIPYAALEPLSKPMFGPELIINLDLSGIWRKVGPPDQVASIGDVLFAHVDQQKALTALFGSRQRWEDALIDGGTYAQNLHSLATAYCDVFTEFQFRSPYRLRSSDGQVRYLIHLTHSDLAHQTFARLFNDSLKRNLFAGRSLDSAARAQAAYSLHQTYRGAVTTLDQVYEEAVGNFDRGQIAVVFREAEARGFGSFDESNRVMTWALEREESRQLPLLSED